MSILKDITPIFNDIFNILATSVQVKLEGEAKIVKKRFTKWLIMWTYYVFALFLVLLGLIFLGAALFALLATTLSVQAAALIVGAIIFVMGTVMTFVVVVNLMR